MAIDTKEHTVTEVAEMLGLHPVTVRRYIRQGVIKPVKRGKEYLLTQEHIQKLPHNHRSQTMLSEMPNLKPIQDMLGDINKTYQQFSEQNARTVQGLASAYKDAVKPIVQKATGEKPEENYETLRAEMMAHMEKPFHRFLVNLMTIKKTIQENAPTFENIPVEQGIHWLVDAMLSGVDEFPETLKAPFEQEIFQQWKQTLLPEKK